MLAKAASVFVVLLLAVLALAFARAHNHVPEAEPPASRASAAVEGATSPPPVQREAREAGRGVYDAQGCATCHSIEGAGNPRYPLDGVADRWEPDEIRAWVTGTGLAADFLSDAIARRKQRYLELPEDEMNAIVLYLSGLTER
jgi:cytochrome c5